LLTGATIVCWAFLAFYVWSGPFFVYYRTDTRGNLLAASFVERLPAVCGIGLYGERAWGRSGGYTYLHKALPLYWLDSERDLVAGTGFNILIYAEPLPAGLGFERLSCFDGVCVGRRPSSCVPTPMRSLPLPDPLLGVAREP